MLKKVSKIRESKTSQALNGYPDSGAFLTELEAILYINAAECHIRQSEFDLAMKTIEESLKLNPKFHKSRIRKIRIRIGLGGTAECKAAEEEIKMILSDSNLKKFHAKAEALLQKIILMKKKTGCTKTETVESFRPK